MSISLPVPLRGRSPRADQVRAKSGKTKNRFFLAPGWSAESRQVELEFSNIGRDPKFMNGRWLGIAILLAAAFSVAGFISVWAALALAVVW